GIITRWKELAEAEPDERRRADYSGLALVFTELTDCHPPWKSALEGWNVEQSQQVLEWPEIRGKGGEAKGKAEAKAEGKAEAWHRLGEMRFPRPLPAEVAARILATTDLAELTRWFDAAVNIGSLDEFRRLVQP